MEKNEDVFTLEMFGVKNEVKLEYASYNCNGTLALQLFCKADEEELDWYARETGKGLEDPYQVPYGVATVNLPESEGMPMNVQFVDENNLPGIGKWLQKNGIAEPLDVYANSGYCCYQAYKFNVPLKELEKIRKTRDMAVGEQGRKEMHIRHK